MTLCTASPQIGQLNQLLIDFLADERTSSDLNDDPREAFVKVVEPYIRRFAKRLAPELQPDQRKEVVNQSILILLQRPPGDFDPSRGNALAYLYYVVRHAVRAVRASYRSATSRNKYSAVTFKSCFSIDQAKEQGRDLSDGWKSAKSLESLCVGKCLLDRIEKPFDDAFYRVYGLGETISDVAADLGLSRFKLSRKLSGYRTELSVLIQ